MKKINLTLLVNEKAKNIGDYLDITPSDVKKLIITLEMLMSTVRTNDPKLLNHILKMNISDNQKIFSLLFLGKEQMKEMLELHKNLSPEEAHRKAQEIIKSYEEKENKKC